MAESRFGLKRPQDPAIPSTPEGFVDMPRESNPPAMEVPAVPDGFIDLPSQGRQQKQEAQESIPEPPQGFEDLPEMPGALAALFSGVSEGVHGVGQSVEALSGSTPEVRPRGPEAQPFEWGDLTSPLSRGLPKAAYMIGESSPTMAGGIAGAVAGSPAGPVGMFAGGIGGSAVGGAIQTLGPIYASELQKDPNDPDGAWDRALKSAASSGTFAGAGWA